MKRILIFIITYNSLVKLPKVIDKIKKIKMQNFKFKVLISDDNSIDGTNKYINKIKKQKNILVNINKRRLGEGGNIKICLDFAIKNKFDFALMVHGDDQYDPRVLNKFYKKIMNNRNCAAVIGSRMTNKKNALKGGMPFYKILGNIILTRIFNFVMKTSFTDAHSGQWLLNLKKIKKIEFRKLSNYHNFDNQLRIILLKKKNLILEAPIRTKYFLNEPAKFHFIYAVRFLLDVLLSYFKK